MSNKLIDIEGLQQVISLIKKDIKNTNDKIDIEKLEELKYKKDKNSISDMIEDLYSKISKKAELPSFTFEDDGKVFGIKANGNTATPCLIDIEQKLIDLANGSSDIKLNMEWDSIKNKPRIVSNISLDNEGLKLLDSLNEDICTLDAIVTPSEINEILSKLNK